MESTDPQALDPLTEAEPWVLTFRQGRTLLAEGVLGFRSAEGQVFLPLGEVSRALGLAIAVDPPHRRAEGFYLRAENRFHLDLDAGTVESAGLRFQIPEGAAGVGEMDLFVELTALDGWLEDLSLVYREAYLLVEVASDPPLPAVQRLARAGARDDLDHLADAGPGRPRRDLPELAADYRLFSPPIIDVDARFGWSDGQGRSGSMGLRGVQDLAAMGARWYVGLDREMKPREVRLALSRKDPSGGLLGPLGLTEIEIGDVGQLGAPLIRRGLRGAGIRITNRPREVASGTTIDLRGELPEGWEAELYRSGILIGYDAEPERGEYLFSDVALYPGVNELTVVRHGPQGQRDERSRPVRLGGDQPAPGTGYGELSALLQRQATIPVARLLGEEADPRGQDPDRGELAAEARFVLGLRPGLSVTTSLSTLSLDGERASFAGLSTRFFLGGADLTLDGAFSPDGDWAAGGRLIVDLAGFGILLQHEELAGDFRSLVSAAGGRLDRRSELRLHRSFRLPPGEAPLHLFLRADSQRGPELQRLGLDLAASTHVGGLQVNHQLAGTFTGAAGSWHLSDLDGSLNLAFRRPSRALRAGLGYSAAPRWRVRNVWLVGSTSRPVRGARLNAALRHELGHGTSVRLGLGWSLPQAELSTDLGYDTAGGLSLGCGMRLSLSWREAGAAPRLDRHSRTAQSLAYARVFVDEDRDGRRSPGERALAGVRLTPGGRDHVTDADGLLVLSRLPELLPTDVLIDATTLPDPFLRPSVPGYRVAARPGAPVDLAFPVIRVSDVEGTVLVTEEVVSPDGSPLGPRTRGLGNVEVVVLDGDGREVARRRSEFDGFFAVPSLPAGRYRLRIDPAQAARFGLEDNGGTEVTLQKDTAILSGLELHLRALQPVTSAPARDQSVQVAKDPVSWSGWNALPSGLW